MQEPTTPADDSAARVDHLDSERPCPSALADVDVVTAAATEADAAARASGVVFREIADHEGIEAICDLFAEIWRYQPAYAPVTSELLHALAKAGSYVTGGYLDEVLVAAAVGFFGVPADTSLHSHIAGVSAHARGRNVGFAIKLHQRAWALARDAKTITWTFDPLVRRNAHFNLGKLGAEVQEYLPDFYGPMHDEINGRDQTDRLLVRWGLRDDSVRAACAGWSRSEDAMALLDRGAEITLASSADGEPSLAESSANTVLIAVPTDVEQLRRRDPERAGRWRDAVRFALSSSFGDGRRVTGFDRAGWYVLSRGLS